MSDTSAHNEDAKLKGIGAGTLVGLVLGLGAGLVAALAFWTWPAETTVLGSLGVLGSGVLVGGAIGLVVGASLAWHGGGVGSTLDRGDAAPIYGVLTGLVLGGSFAPILGGVLGLLLDQLVGGLLFGVAFGPLVGIIGWETGYWAADYLRGKHHAH